MAHQFLSANLGCNVVLVAVSKMSEAWTWQHSLAHRRDSGNGLADLSCHLFSQILDFSTQLLVAPDQSHNLARVKGDDLRLLGTLFTPSLRLYHSIKIEMLFVLLNLTRLHDITHGPSPRFIRCEVLSHRRRALNSRSAKRPPGRAPSFMNDCIVLL